jgi:hypothetical protein
VPKEKSIQEIYHAKTYTATPYVLLAGISQDDYPDRVVEFPLALPTTHTGNP